MVHGIDDAGVSIEGISFKRSDAVYRRHIHMVFKGPGPGQQVETVAPACRPFRRTDDELRPLQSQVPVKLREPQIIADGSAAAHAVQFKHIKRLSRRKELFLFEHTEKVGFTICVNNLPCLINCRNHIIYPAVFTDGKRTGQ